MKINIVKLFAQYIKYHISGIIAFAGFSCLFLLVFLLYGVPTEAVIYAIILCLLVCAVFVPIHFYKYYNRHKSLLIAKKNLPLISELPQPANLIEDDYFDIIKSIAELNTALENDFSAWKSDSIDYYTTWVHQIKTPISAMRLMLRQEDTDENQKLLSELFQIEQYVEMVLTYFRLDSDSSDLLIKQYPLDSIIRTEIRKYASQFVINRLKLSYDGTDVSVITDEKWLSFIIGQILSNAIKYTHSGGVTISVSDDMILTIADTGIGIRSEDLPRIFEKGFTGYNGRADKKSTGLGLYLAKRTADMLCCKISVSSEIGKGSVFAIDLRHDTLEIE